MDDQGRAPADGTPVTKAPEMWSGETGTTASDVYSIGVSFYRLLTGEWPFQGSTNLEESVLSGDYADLRDVAPHVPRRLASRIKQSMALNPGDRYRSWREMH